MCWHIEELNDSLSTDESWAPPVEICNMLNDSSTVEIPVKFNQTGDFSFVAEFANEISKKRGMLNFTVTPRQGMCSRVLAST